MMDSYALQEGRIFYHGPKVVATEKRKIKDKDVYSREYTVPKDL